MLPWFARLVMRLPLIPGGAVAARGDVGREARGLPLRVKTIGILRHQVVFILCLEVLESRSVRPLPSDRVRFRLLFFVLIQARMFPGLRNRVRQKLLSMPHRCTRKESQCDQDAQGILVINRTQL
jgi:hypothetical protein